MAKTRHPQYGGPGLILDWGTRSHTPQLKILRAATKDPTMKTEDRVCYSEDPACVRVSHSVVSNSVTPKTIALQAPLSMEFSRQECWSGWPFPSPGDLPNPGIEPGSPALQADALLSELPGNSRHCNWYLFNGNILTIFYLFTYFLSPNPAFYLPFHPSMA